MMKGLALCLALLLWSFPLLAGVASPSLNWLRPVGNPASVGQHTAGLAVAAANWQERRAPFSVFENRQGSEQWLQWHWGAWFGQWQSQRTPELSAQGTTLGLNLGSANLAWRWQDGKSPQAPWSAQDFGVALGWGEHLKLGFTQGWDSTMQAQQGFGVAWVAARIRLEVAQWTQIDSQNQSYTKLQSDAEYRWQDWIIGLQHQQLQQQPSHVEGFVAYQAPSGLALLMELWAEPENSHFDHGSRMVFGFQF